MGFLVNCIATSRLRGPIDGDCQREQEGGETLPGAAYIELYRTRQAIPSRPREDRLWNRILDAVGIADRSVRSS